MLSLTLCSYWQLCHFHLGWEQYLIPLGLTDLCFSFALTLLVIWFQVPCAHLVCLSMTPSEGFCCLLLFVLSHGDYSRTLYPFLTCCSYHASPPRKKVYIIVWYGWGTFCYNYTRALWHDRPSRLARFILVLLPPAFLHSWQNVVSTNCRPSLHRKFWKGGEWGKAGQEISQPSAFHQETNVK